MYPRLKIESKLGRSLGSRFNRAAIRFLNNDQSVRRLGKSWLGLKRILVLRLLGSGWPLAGWAKVDHREGTVLI